MIRIDHNRLAWRIWAIRAINVCVLPLFLVATFGAMETSAWSQVDRGTSGALFADEQLCLTLKGLTRPSRQAQLALRASGILAARPIKEGQQIDAGQLIAELDSEPERATLAINTLRAESDHTIRSAQISQKLAKQQWERLQSLAKREASSPWEILEAELTHQLAEIRVEEALFEQALLKHGLERDRVLLSQRRLMAPFAGSIWRTFKQQGEAVEELEPIVELVALHPIWVELDVPSEQFGRVHVGQAATVTVGSRSEPGTVITVDPLVDAGSATFRVRVELPNEDRSRVAGVLATVRFGPAPVSTEKTGATDRPKATAKLGAHHATNKTLAQQINGTR